jgi:two-component system cell cycle response regulator DivK
MDAAKTVLIVEDDARNMRYFSDVLEFSGYVVLKAGGAIDGLALARERRPDLILMDVGMPGMPGDEAVKSLKAEDALRDIPVVMLTAFAMKDQVERIQECGCAEVKTKPISPSDLQEVVRRYTA